MTDEKQLREEVLSDIVSDIVIETGSEPDGMRLCIKTTEELEEIIRPIIYSKLHEVETKAREDERRRIILEAGGSFVNWNKEKDN